MPTDKESGRLMGSQAVPPRKSVNVRAAAVRIHRWLALAAAAFWLVQAVTGVLILFHWELDDAAIAGAHRPTDLAAIERRLDALAPSGSGRTVDSVWTTGGSGDRYDVTVKTPAGEESVRIDGAGGVLRTMRDGERSVSDTLVVIHQNLLGGDVGAWIVGVSGVLLLSAILVGIGVAWPRGRAWRRAFRPPPGRLPKVARLYGWHRALGLWAGVPAAVLVAVGVSLVFEDGVARLLGAPEIEPSARAAGPAAAPSSAASFSRVAATALARYPGSTLTAVSFPSGERPSWRVRVRQPDELRRAFGTTTLFIDRGGRVLADHDAHRAAPARWLLDALYPIHTGESAGLPGRLAVLAIGCWLVTISVIGLLLWSARRKLRRRNP